MEQDMIDKLLDDFATDFKENHLESFKEYLQEEWEPLDFRISYAGRYKSHFDIDLVGTHGVEVSLRTRGGKVWTGTIHWKVRGTTVLLNSLHVAQESPEETVREILKLTFPIMEKLAHQSVDLCHIFYKEDSER